jgi:hypothetical protein
MVEINTHQVYARVDIGEQGVACVWCLEELRKEELALTQATQSPLGLGEARIAPSPLQTR